MGRIIFDIETAGKDFESFDKSVQEYLLKWAESEKEESEIRESLSLYPVTGEIITIGMLNPDTGKGAVFFQNNDAPLLPFEEDGIHYETGTEETIIRKFWETIRSYDQFISFNGRTFDCPYVMVRSAVHRLKPLRNLLPNRYGETHIDLFDQLSFYGAVRRKFSLDMWCRTFGITSPKEGGLSGEDVQTFYRDGRCLEIAKYCLRDIRATAELLSVWEKYIRTS